MSHAGANCKHEMYQAWAQMRARCRCPTHHSYHRYGGRGIRVCDRWQSFAAFLEDMGPRPPGMTLDRIDNDGDYSPENCVWKSRLQQARNRQHTKIFEFDGFRGSINDLCEHYGIELSTVRARLKRGMDVEDALTAPLRWKRRGIRWGLF